ncbi:MAG: MFS transporter [Dehalococcoidia bacterium]|nr:MFS transporter [Dehalococcoidia bacterium]
MEQKAAPGPAILGRWRVPFFYGWVIVAVCYSADFFASGLGQSTVSLFFKPMKDSLGWSLSALVGATTAATFGGIIVSPFLGRAIDRFGVKPVMLWGTVVGGVGMILMMFIQEVWQFWLLYTCVAALGLAEFSGLASQSAVAKWFIQRRGRALTFSTLGQTTGNIAFAPLVAFLITLLGWRHAWGAMGLTLLLVMVPLVAILIRNQPEDVGLKPDGDWKPSGNGASRAPVVSDVSWTLREALRTRALWALMGTFVIGGSTMAMTITLAPYLTLKHNMSNQAVGWVIVGFWIPGTGSRLIWGYLIDKLPARLCLFIVSVGRGIGVFSLALVPYPYNIGVWWFFSGLVGNAFGILQPVMFANFFGRKAFATIQGGVRPIMAVPGLIFPLLIARFYDISGSFTWGFLFCGCLGFLGAVASLFAKAPTKPESAKPID